MQNRLRLGIRLRPFFTTPSPNADPSGRFAMVVVLRVAA